MTTWSSDSTESSRSLRPACKKLQVNVMVSPEVIEIGST